MALPNILGNFFYSRTIVCDGIAENAALYFGGVQNSVSVWINGVFVGKHEGYCTPFEMEIPSGVLKKGENTIVLSQTVEKVQKSLGFFFILCYN